MKNFLIISCCGLLYACAGSETIDNGLMRLDAESKNCGFLYTLNVNATTYTHDDAIDYLEKNILDQEKGGDSYYIVDEKILKNAGAIFGPKNTYKFKVKVYNCKK